MFNSYLNLMNHLNRITQTMYFQIDDVIKTTSTLALEIEKK